MIPKIQFRETTFSHSKYVTLSAKLIASRILIKHVSIGKQRESLDILGNNHGAS